MTETKAVDANVSIKEVELRDGENVLKCEILVINKFFQASIYDSNNNSLENNKFNLLKEQNKLQIELQYLIKKVYKCALNEYLNNNDYIRIIKELKE